MIINKSIKLIGENKNTTIIDGLRNGDVIHCTTDWVTISGFTLQNSGRIYLQDAGLEIRSYFGNFSDSIMFNNRCGIYLNDASSNRITGNIIMHNADGILIYGAYNTILRNSLTDNWYGIYLFECSTNTIMKNNFRRNKFNAFFINGTNVWECNYWTRPRFLPKLIFGVIEVRFKWTLWANIDWYPAQEPYAI